MPYPYYITADTIFSPIIYTYLIDASTNSITFTLPSMPPSGLNFLVVRKDNITSNTIKIIGTEPIDGNPYLSLAAYNQANRLVFWDGQWYTIHPHIKPS